MHLEIDIATKNSELITLTDVNLISFTLSWAFITFFSSLPADQTPMRHETGQGYSAYPILGWRVLGPAQNGAAFAPDLSTSRSRS